MNWKILIITLILGLVGCQKTTKVIVQDNSKPDIENQTEDSGWVGGAGDTAGGNGLNGRPFEAYISKLEDTVPIFKTHIQPLINRISEIHKPLAADLLYIAQARKWYFMPVSLKKIPSVSIGVYFQDKKNEQYALQTMTSIWFDKEKLDAMTTNDQLMILMHELVMGVRLLEFSSQRDRCLAESLRVFIETEDSKMYEEKKNECFTLKMKIGSGIHDVFTPNEIILSKNDYETVRNLTADLVNNLDDLSELQLKAFTEDNLRRD